MLNNKDFARLWRNNKSIDPDQIQDQALRSMYVEYLAHELDMDDLYWKIERYIGGTTGKRLGIFGEGNADVEEQPNGRGPRLSN